MPYFSQLENADCLIATMECLLQTQRSLLPPPEYYKMKDVKPVTYKWVGDTLREFGNFKFEYKLCPTNPKRFKSLDHKKCRAITGTLFDTSKNILHAMYQENDTFWCGHIKDFYHIDERQFGIFYRITESRIDDLDYLYNMHWKITDMLKLENI